MLPSTFLPTVIPTSSSSASPTPAPTLSSPRSSSLIEKMAEKPKVCVFMGAAVIDLISYVDRFPLPGETLSGNHFHKGFGGKSANSCVMAAKLGQNCRMLTKLGNEDFGREMIQNFVRNKISKEFIFVTDQAHSGTATIAVTRRGENNIVYVPGSTNLLTSNEISQVSDKLFADCCLFVSTFECVSDTLHTALSLARKHKVTTLVNGAPPFPKPMENSHIYALCDILCVNETEAHLMTKMCVDTLDDSRIACKMILDKGCGSVVLTLGEKGALFVDRNNALHIPVPKVDAIDTTGAGDCFMGALAFFMINHPQLTKEEQIRRANIVASVTVQRKGAQESFPSKDELPAEIFQ